MKQTPHKRIAIFRHGETEWNRLNKFQGHSDIPLNENGFVQARRLLKPMQHFQPEIILSSDLMRAVQTAEVLASFLKVPLIQHPELREANLGEVEGLTADEIADQFGRDILDRWKSSHKDHLTHSYPGGESGESVLKRVMQILEHYLHTTPHTRIAVSCHGGVMRRMINHIYAQQSTTTSQQRFSVPISNGLLFEFEYFRDKTWNLKNQFQFV